MNSSRFVCVLESVVGLDFVLQCLPQFGPASLCALANRANNFLPYSLSFVVVVVLHDGLRSINVVGLRDGGGTGPCADWFLTHDISHSSSFNVPFPTPFNYPVDKHAAIGELV